MNIRRQVMEVLQGVFGFGKITRSTGHGVYDTDGEIGEAVTPECERWGDAAVLSRPQVGAEVKYIQLGDERVILATREPRWQVDVAAGEVVVRAMGAGSPAYVRLRPNGDVQIVGANIHLGAEAVSTFVALASYVDARLTAIQTKFDAHTHTVTGATPAAPPTPVLTLPVIPAQAVGSLASTAASKTRAQ